jgi:enoyl-CoA hydratase/carnithine racemase
VLRRADRVSLGDARPPEVALGIPSSYGAALLAAPPQLARELVFTGRVLSAEESLSFGIVRAIEPDVVAAALILAEQMTKLGRPVLTDTKRMVIESMIESAAARAWEAQMRQFEEALFGPRTR